MEPQLDKYDSHDKELKNIRTKNLGWHCPVQCQVIFGIISQDPRISKFNQLHAGIFWFFGVKMWVYSIESSKVIGKFPEVLNFDQLFLKLNQLNM